MSYYLFHAYSLFLCFIWNASVLLGSLWLIVEKDWSPWTLVATLCFFAKWTRLPKQKQDKPQILLETK